MAYGSKILLLNERGTPLQQAVGSVVRPGAKYEFLLCEKNASEMTNCKNPFWISDAARAKPEDLVVFVDAGSLKDLEARTEKASQWYRVLNEFHRIAGMAGVGATLILFKGAGASVGSVAGGVAGTVVGPGAGNIVGGVVGFGAGIAIGTAAGVSVASGHGYVLSHTTHRWKNANAKLVEYFDDVFALDGGLKIRNAESRRDVGFVMRGLAHAFRANIKPEFSNLVAGDPLEFE